MHYFSIYFIKYSTCFGQVHHEEYLNTVYTQQVFVMLVLSASASVVRMEFYPDHQQN